VTRLAELVATSQRVAATSGRRAKVRELAALLVRDGLTLEEAVGRDAAKVPA